MESSISNNPIASTGHGTINPVSRKICGPIDPVPSTSNGPIIDSLSPRCPLPNAIQPRMVLGQDLLETLQDASNLMGNNINLDLSILNEAVATSGPSDSVVSQNTSNIAVNITTNTSIEEYFNRTTYECNLCKAKLQSRKKFQYHVQEWHQLTENEYMAKQPTDTACPIFNIVPDSLYKCEVCGITLIWDEFNIEEHLAREHEMSLQEYAR